MTNHKSATQVSSGVDDLIKRLRDEGVAEGRQRAEKIVTEAESRAEWLIRQAKDEAENIVNKAREDAELMQKSGIEALHVAARDTLLALKAHLAERFTAEVQRLVSEELGKDDLLQRLILEIAGRTRADIAQSEQIEMLLPRDAFAVEELVRSPDALERGELGEFIRMAGSDMLREGITFRAAEDDRKGLRIVLKDRGVILDLSDEAVAQLLLQHLQPRFRALLEGILS